MLLAEQTLPIEVGTLLALLAGAVGYGAKNAVAWARGRPSDEVQAMVDRIVGRLPCAGHSQTIVEHGERLAKLETVASAKLPSIEQNVSEVKEKLDVVHARIDQVWAHLVNGGKRQ